MSAINLAVTGCAASCGAVLVVAGAGKLYRGVAGIEDMTAIRMALRMPRRPWRLFGLAAGAVECAAGLAVASGRFPLPAGTALAALGAVFCALLVYVRVKKVPGDCGCIRVRRGTSGAAPAPAWRGLTRAALMLAAGVGYAIYGVSAPWGSWWFWGGAAAGLVVLVLLSVSGPVRTPRCHRPLWRQAPATLRALAGHETFVAMAGSAGPFGHKVRYRQVGCADEFWFTVAGGDGGRAAVFTVRRAARGTRLAVHSALRDVPDGPMRVIMLADGPARAVAVAD